MKYVFVIFTVLFCSFGAFALDARQIQNQLQQLENEISQLEAKYNKKSAELQACEKSSQNFKIAGIATLAGTGAGVMGNIALRKKYAEKGGIGLNKDIRVATIEESKQSVQIEVKDSSDF